MLLVKKDENLCCQDGTKVLEEEKRGTIGFSHVIDWYYSYETKTSGGEKRSAGVFSQCSGSHGTDHLLRTNPGRQPQPAPCTCSDKKSEIPTFDHPQMHHMCC